MTLPSQQCIVCYAWRKFGTLSIKKLRRWKIDNLVRKAVDERLDPPAEKFFRACPKHEHDLAASLLRVKG